MKPVTSPITTSTKETTPKHDTRAILDLMKHVQEYKPIVRLYNCSYFLQISIQVIRNILIREGIKFSKQSNELLLLKIVSLMQQKTILDVLQSCAILQDMKKVPNNKRKLDVQDVAKVLNEKKKKKKNLYSNYYPKN